MAYKVPTIRPKSKQFELQIHHLKPEDIEPNGDRYCVDVIGFDESILLESLMVVTKDPNVNPRDPSADPRIEGRGVLAGIIVTRGDGHLLGLPDPRIYVGGDNNKNYNASNDIVRVPADVPMKYNYGDVVLIDLNMRGRSLKILGREIRIVNQVDILARVTSLKMVYVNGSWEEARK